MRPEDRLIPRPPPAPQVAQARLLTVLVYELLDAHIDTEQLMSAPSTHLEWLAHLHYLRDLQRSARETLARATAP